VTDFNQLAAPRYAEGVRRLLGEDIQVATVAPELAPYVSLQSDRPEWQVLFGETPWSHGGVEPLLAANRSSIGIQQPQKERITVVEKVLISNDTAAPQQYKIGLVVSPTFDSSTKAAVRDGRKGVVTTILGLRQQVAGQLTRLPGFFIPANSSLILDLPWMLSFSVAFNGFFTLLVESGVVAQDVLAYFWGYERALRPEELVVD